MTDRDDSATQAPRSVCVPFGIFVCTRCSGIFRDFNFRIKSISASTFSGDEVEMLRRKGNEAARRTFLARWNPAEPLPQSGNTVRGKVWIKAVFVDKLYYDDAGAGSAVGGQVAPATPAAQPAATKAPDLFGGLFDSPVPAQVAPTTQPPQQTAAPAPASGADWTSFATAAFDSRPQAAEAPSFGFEPPPAVARQSYAASVPESASVAPVSQAPAAPTQQSDLFGGLTIETPAAPVETPAAPASRPALEEDFWTLSPQVPPQPHVHPRVNAPGIQQYPAQMPPQMQMPGMMPPQMQQMPGMMPPQMQQMPGMMPPQMQQMPGMMPPQMQQMPGMMPPQMQQMPGLMPPQTQMQMSGMMPPQVMAPVNAQTMPQQSQQPPVQQEAPPVEPEQPDPFASFGELTGIKSKTGPPPAQAVPVPSQAPEADVFGSLPSQESQTPPAAPPTVAPVAPVATAAPPPVPAKPVNLGPMGFPMPVSQPPAPATDTHQAMMFEDIKAHSAGDSFSFAPVDSPQPSISKPAPIQHAPVAAPGTAQPTATAAQYSADNPFAFI